MIFNIFNTLLNLITLGIAIYALRTWRKEVRGSSKYKVLNEAIILWNEIDLKIQDLKSDYSECREYEEDYPYEVEEYIDSKFARFIVEKQEQLNKIIVLLSQHGINNDEIVKIDNLFKLYKERYSDRPFLTTQTICINDEEKEINSFINSFYKMYFEKNKDKKNSAYKELLALIQSGLEILKKETTNL